MPVSAINLYRRAAFACLALALGLALTITSGQSLAADPAMVEQIRQLESRVAGLQQEQLAAYQNFQMLQEMRRLELADAAVIQGPGAAYAPPQNYDDMVRAQRDRQARIDKYSADLAQTYSRSLDIQDQIRSLRSQIIELGQR